MIKTKLSLEHSEVKEQDLTEIRQYLKESKRQGAKFYVQKRRLGESVLRAIEFNVSDIDANNELVNYFLETEKRGDKIFVRNPKTGIRRVSFTDNNTNILTRFLDNL